MYCCKCFYCFDAVSMPRVFCPEQLKAILEPLSGHSCQRQLVRKDNKGPWRQVGFLMDVA